MKSQIKATSDLKLGTGGHAFGLTAVLSRVSDSGAFDHQPCQMFLHAHLILGALLDQTPVFQPTDGDFWFGDFTAQLCILTSHGLDVQQVPEDVHWLLCVRKGTLARSTS